MTPRQEKLTNEALQRDLDLVSVIAPQPYRPENATPFEASYDALPKFNRHIVIAGENITLHATNNFHSFIRAYMGAQQREVFFASKKERDFITSEPVSRMMKVFEAGFPDLFADLQHYDNQRILREEAKLRLGESSPIYMRLLQELHVGEEDITKEKLTYSITYDTLCEIVKKLGIDINPGTLTVNTYSYVYTTDTINTAELFSRNN